MKLHHHLMLWNIWHNCHKIPSCISSGNSSWKQPANAKQLGSVAIHCLFAGASISDTGKREYAFGVLIRMCSNAHLICITEDQVEHMRYCESLAYSYHRSGPYGTTHTMFRLMWVFPVM